MSSDLTLDAWVRKEGGPFAHLLELRQKGGNLFALIRTSTSWDPKLIRVPIDDVYMTLNQYRSINTGTIIPPSEKPKTANHHRPVAF